LRRFGLEKKTPGKEPDELIWERATQIPAGRIIDVSPAEAVEWNDAAATTLPKPLLKLEGKWTVTYPEYAGGIGSQRMGRRRTREVTIDSSGDVVDRYYDGSVSSNCNYALAEDVLTTAVKKDLSSFTKARITPTAQGFTLKYIEPSSYLE